MGEKHRAIGSLDGKISNLPEAEWWQDFDPCSLPSCSRCSFLPVCWGGCPKKHLEGDQHALDEQSNYWRLNLYNKVVSYVNCTPRQASVLTEEDQFREGYA